MPQLHSKDMYQGGQGQPLHHGKVYWQVAVSMRCHVGAATPAMRCLPTSQAAAQVIM